MLATANLPTAKTPRATLADYRLPAFAKHLVTNERATVHKLIDLLERPERYQDEFVAYLCGVNTSDFRPLDNWEGFLARNVKWRELREDGPTIDTPQLIVDLTKVPEDERPLHGDRLSFAVKAHDKQRCPDAFGYWSFIAMAFREERHGRPLVIWEVEPSY